MHSTSQQSHSDSALQKQQMTLQHCAALLDDQLVAKALQQQIRPVTPWHAQGIVFEHCVVPALHLTGDSLDYFMLPDGRLFLYLADVSGSGTAAALISILLKGIVQEFVASHLDDATAAQLTPAALLTYLNTRLLSYGSDRHVTLICMIVDTEHAVLQWSVAGHLPSPILYTQGRARFLTGQGQPVGLFEQAVFNNEQMPLPEAFSLSLFSDGVFDVMPEQHLITSEAALPKLITTAKGDYAAAVECLGLANCSNMPDDIAMLVLSRNLA